MCEKIEKGRENVKKVYCASFIKLCGSHGYALLELHYLWGQRKGRRFDYREVKSLFVCILGHTVSLRHPISLVLRSRVHGKDIGV